MKYCYEYFGCANKEECPAFCANTKHCWEIEGVKCEQPKKARANEIGFSKSEFCESMCEYREYARRSTIQ